MINFLLANSLPLIFSPICLRWKGQYSEYNVSAGIKKKRSYMTPWEQSATLGWHSEDVQWKGNQYFKGHLLFIHHGLRYPTEEGGCILPCSGNKILDFSPPPSQALKMAHSK